MAVEVEGIRDCVAVETWVSVAVEGKVAVCVSGSDGDPLHADIAKASKSKLSQIENLRMEFLEQVFGVAILP